VKLLQDPSVTDYMSFISNTLRTFILSTLVEIPRSKYQVLVCVVSYVSSFKEEVFIKFVELYKQDILDIKSP
jgi:hypothetical protein